MRSMYVCLGEWNRYFLTDFLCFVVDRKGFVGILRGWGPIKDRGCNRPPFEGLLIDFSESQVPSRANKGPFKALLIDFCAILTLPKPICAFKRGWALLIGHWDLPRSLPEPKISSKPWKSHWNPSNMRNFYPTLGLVYDRGGNSTNYSILRMHKCHSPSLFGPGQSTRHTSWSLCTNPKIVFRQQLHHECPAPWEHSFYLQIWRDFGKFLFWVCE